MNVGVSSACLYPLETEESFLFLAKSGVKRTEIFFNGLTELKDSFIDELLDIKERYGVEITAIHPYASFAEPFLIFSEYYRRFIESKEIYNNYFNIAKRLGAKYVTLHGDKIHGKLTVEEYCERYLELYLLAKEKGVTLNQENVANFRSRDVEFIAEMSKILGDNVSYTLDIKQCIRSGVNPLDMINAMGENINHIHISDHSYSSDCLLPFNGGFNFKGFFELMKAQNYKGDFIIEVYNNAYKNPKEIIESYNSLLKICE